MKIDAGSIAVLLNEMFAADATATHALIINRIPCNKALADHPHVIVDQLGLADRTVVGIIGFLNGLLTANGSDEVVAYSFSDEDGEGTSTRPLLGFVVVPREQS